MLRKAILSLLVNLPGETVQWKSLLTKLWQRKRKTKKLLMSVPPNTDNFVWTQKITMCPFEKGERRTRTIWFIIPFSIKMLDSLSDDYVKSKGWISCERSGTFKFCVVKKINYYRFEKWEKKQEEHLIFSQMIILNPNDEKVVKILCCTANKLWQIRENKNEEGNDESW